MKKLLFMSTTIAVLTLFSSKSAEKFEGDSTGSEMKDIIMEPGTGTKKVSDDIRSILNETGHTIHVAIRSKNLSPKEIRLLRISSRLIMQKNREIFLAREDHEGPALYNPKGMFITIKYPKSLMDIDKNIMSNESCIILHKKIRWRIRKNRPTENRLVIKYDEGAKIVAELQQR